MANSWQNITWTSRGGIRPLTCVVVCQTTEQGGNAPRLSPSLSSRNEGRYLKRVLDPQADPLSLPTKLPWVLILAVNSIRWLYWRHIKNNARTDQMWTVLPWVSSVEGTQAPNHRGIMEVRNVLWWLWSIQPPSPIYYSHSWI